MNYATQKHTAYTATPVTPLKLLTIPGFFADPGRPYVKGSCALWLNAFGYKEVPADQKLETPLGIRIHDWERDWPHAQVAIEEGLELGFTPHLNMATWLEGVTERQQRLVEDRFDLDVIDSVGNSTDVKSGYYRWQHFYTDEVQDDSGVRGAVANARALTETPISFHGYGDAGFSPKHIQGLRAMYPSRQFTIMELHWGFRGHQGTPQYVRKVEKYLRSVMGLERGSALYEEIMQAARRGEEHPDMPGPRKLNPTLYTPAAGAYIKNMVEVAHRFDMACCLFSFRDFFREDGSLEDSMRVLVGLLAEAEPLKPPAGKAMMLSLGMLRRRYLP